MPVQSGLMSKVKPFSVLISPLFTQQHQVSVNEISFYVVTDDGSTSPTGHS